MNFTTTIGENHEIELPEQICQQLSINTGCILEFKTIKEAKSIEIKKHEDQSLTDEEIEKAGNLSRVFPLK